MELYIYKELQEAIQISVCLCTIYGIVIIEIYSHNKELYLLNTVALYPSLFWLTPKKENPKMRVVYHGAPTYIYIYIYIYICNTLPLDNLKIHLHIAQPYITWGLIWCECDSIANEEYYASHNRVNFSHTSYHNRNLILWVNNKRFVSKIL